MGSSSSSRRKDSKRDATTGIKPPKRESAANPKLYDVFISHRGPDVKDTLALQLYHSLQKAGFRAFLDREEIELGDLFPSSIVDAIRSASVQIIIFSKGFADSRWCLDELVLILETGVRIIPVFYHVEPFHLRYIKKGEYAAAFSRHKKNGRYTDHKLEEWKEALFSVSQIQGYEFSKHNHDHDKLCQSLLSSVRKEIEKKAQLDVAKYPVGLVELVEDFERECGQKEEGKVNVVGIFGMGGSGKSTLAKELFNIKRSKYDGSSFLCDVREASANRELPCLQSKLLKDLVHDEQSFQSASEGTSYMRHRLRGGGWLRFLIVVDDIDDVDQLEALVVTDAMSSGSLVIVTTRDERVLIRATITLRYKMKAMNPYESRQLFCWHAFHQSHPASGYETLVESFVKECGGLPLSLRVLGCHVCGSNDKFYWKRELDKIRRTLPDNIKERLKISLDALDTEQKQIFMDIACFFIGKPTSMAMRIWEGSGWSGEHAIQTLKDKSLVEEVADNSFSDEFGCQVHSLRMHDHLRDLGRELADGLISPRRIWRPQHLESLGFKNILTETNVRCFNKCYERFFVATYFVGNPKTSTVPLWLGLYLRWSGPLASIPSWIPLQNVQVLKIAGGDLERLWQSDLQVPFKLKELHLLQISLKELGNSIGMLNGLENLVINNNKGIQIEGKYLSESLRQLTNLKSLKLNCIKICGDLALNNWGESTSYNSSISSLEKIEIIWVGISNVSICGDFCPSLNAIRLNYMEDLIEVNLRRVATLKSLELHFCIKLEVIAGISDLEQLVELKIKECPKLEELPSLARLNCLETITIERCSKLQNIRDIQELQGLRSLTLLESNRAAWNCIGLLQRVPSLVIAVGTAGFGVESTLNPSLFSNVIDAKAITEICSDDKKVTVRRPESLSTIIICALIQTNGSYISFPRPSADSMWRNGYYLPEGEWIVTILMSGNTEVSCAKHYIDKSEWIGKSSKGWRKGYMVTVNKGEEWKSSLTLKRIISSLYDKYSGCPYLTLLFS